MQKIFSATVTVMRNNRFWIMLSMGLFFLSYVVVFAGINVSADLPLGFIEEGGLGSLEKIVEIIMETSPLVGVLLIFVNNTLTALQMLVLGVVMGLSPILTIIFNGAILGLVSHLVIESGIPYSFLAASILPHGIPELGAIFLCAALGIKLGFHTVFRPLPGRSRKESFKDIWREIGAVLPAVILVLFIAAFLEMFLTPLVIAIFFRDMIPLF